jgi:hypothetical protein
MGFLIATMCVVPRIGLAQSLDEDREVMAALEAFLEGWNSRRVEQYAGALHFPHVILNAGSARIWEEKSDFLEIGDQHWDRAPQEWDHTEWRKREIVHRVGVVAHVAGTWARINHGGEVFMTADVLYVVVKKGGRWGVQARSGDRAQPPSSGIPDSSTRPSGVIE